MVVGAGVSPDTMLAGRAGLEVEDGIVCDETLQSSVEGIYAAGDVCSYQSRIHGRRLRVEHWDVAMQQGRHAARAMLGESSRRTRWCPTSSATSPTGRASSTSGRRPSGTKTVWRGDPDAGEFSVFYLSGGKVAGALSVGRSEDLGHARELLAKGVDVSASVDLLSDADADLAPLTSDI